MVLILVYAPMVEIREIAELNVSYDPRGIPMEVEQAELRLIAYLREHAASCTNMQAHALKLAYRALYLALSPCRLAVLLAACSMLEWVYSIASMLQDWTSSREQARNLAPLHSSRFFYNQTCDEDEVEGDASHAISLA